MLFLVKCIMYNGKFSVESLHFKLFDHDLMLLDFLNCNFYIASFLPHLSKINLIVLLEYLMKCCDVRCISYLDKQFSVTEEPCINLDCGLLCA